MNHSNKRVIELFMLPRRTYKIRFKITLNASSMLGIYRADVKGALSAFLQ